jgi:fibronectin type 3 domain-containing protein
MKLHNRAMPLAMPRSLLYPALIATLFVLTPRARAAGEVTKPQNGTVVSQGHRVDLVWNASTSPDVIGYNIYRGNRSGGPYSKINPVPNASTVYTDTSVTDGNTYYYVTTSVNSDNQESGYSNQSQATIP